MQKGWEYVWNVNWQEIIALSIVGTTVLMFLLRRFRPRKFNFQTDTHCGCSSPSQSAPGSSIVIQGRRGEAPRITVKMK